MSGVLPGFIETVDDGYKCTDCGEKISPSETCIEVDFAKVAETDEGGPHLNVVNYGGVYHTDCFPPEPDAEGEHE